MNDEQMVICILQRLYIRGHLAKAPLQIATIAIEKQIPKNPIVKKSKFYPYDNLYSCPICCKREFEKGKYEYCPDCGQMLNWELL